MRAKELLQLKREGKSVSVGRSVGQEKGVIAARRIEGRMTAKPQNQRQHVCKESQGSSYGRRLVESIAGS